jgi:hypothetical protein
MKTLQIVPLSSLLEWKPLQLFFPESTLSLYYSLEVKWFLSVTPASNRQSDFFQLIVSTLALRPLMVSRLFSWEYFLRLVISG